MNRDSQELTEADSSWCPHLERTRRICVHLANSSADDDYGRLYAGGRQEDYDLICLKCRDLPESEKPPFISVCEVCFGEVEAYGCVNFIVGKPVIPERLGTLRFHHAVVKTPKGFGDSWLDLQPVVAASGMVWIALTEDQRLAEVDFEAGTCRDLCSVEHPLLSDSKKNLTLHLSADGKVAAVVQDRGQYGIVVTPESGAMTMTLDRGNYYTSASRFPVAFFALDGRLLMVHGTNWNRLDVSDPLTEEILSLRPCPLYRGRPSNHYLDYFHGGLTVSPDQEWIVDDGWLWHPHGFPETWSLRRWVRENPWESEDGETKKFFQDREDWDHPLCWIDSRTVAFLDVNEHGIVPSYPAVTLFNVERGQRFREFPGPEGALVFDDYLFASSPERGTSVWDVETGELLLRDPELKPIGYHPGARRFLSRGEGNAYLLSRLEPV